MAKSSGKTGPNFDLPDEILAVMPTDPYDQLDLARKITSMALASRVSELEADVAKMEQKLQDKDRMIYEFQEKLSHLERAYRDATSDLRAIHEENIKLSNERDSLAFSSRKLGRDFAKLESFKRQLMQSLTGDESIQAEGIDPGTAYQSAPKAYPDKDDEGSGYSVHRSFDSSVELRCTIPEAGSGHEDSAFSLNPHVKTRFSPIGTPKIPSRSVSPGLYSALESPRRNSGSTSPKNAHYAITLSAHYPSSQHSSAKNSPPRARTPPARVPTIDGKEFFRQTRNRLSYEQFSAFLANVKELNAHKQTREETLRKAEEIFGLDNKDLYISFRGLLYRNSH